MSISQRQQENAMQLSALINDGYMEKTEILETIIETESKG